MTTPSARGVSDLEHAEQHVELPADQPLAPPPRTRLVESYRRGARLLVEAFRLHPGVASLSLFAATIFALATVFYSRALGNLVDQVVEPIFEERRTLATGDVVRVILTFVGLGLLRAVFIVARRSQAGRWQYRLAQTHRAGVIDQLTGQPIRWFRRRDTGSLLSAAEADPDAAVAVIAPLPFSLGSLVMVAGGVIWFITIDPPLGLVAAVLLPLLAVVNITFERFAEGPAEAVQEGVASLTATVHESVDGIAVVKALGIGESRERVANTRIAALRAAKLRKLRVATWFDLAMDALPAIASVALLLFGAWRLDRGGVTKGELVALVNLFSMLLWPLRMLAFTFAALPQSLAGRSRIADVLQDAIPGRIARTDPKDASLAFELRDVSVVHDDGRVALSNVDLDIPLGRRVAIVGGTGSGKSTLLNLLAGLDAPDAGSVRAKDWGTLVFQEPVLFVGSINHNLELGTSVSDADRSRALANAAAAPIVEALDQGIHTRVGERGVTLSGGQRQRIALARAFARQPNVLLLDDTTSSLDPATEAEVLANLASDDRHRTLVMVATRPSSVALADEIVVLDAGSVVAQGSHDELYESSAVYRELVSAYGLAAPS